jgi:hypothetical protein
VKLLLALIAIAAVAAAAIIANLALLSYASSGNDPVGKLSPRANVSPAPATVFRPQRGPVQGEESDD